MSEHSNPPARDTHFHQVYPKVICHVVHQLLDIARNPGPPSHLLYLPPLPTDFTSVASTDNSQRSLNSSISQPSSSQMRPTRVSLLPVFFFLFSFFFFVSKEQKLLCLSCGRWRITQTLDLVPKKSYHHLGLSPMRPNELWTCPHDGAARAQAPGCQQSRCGSVRRGRGGDQCSQ